LATRYGAPGGEREPPPRQAAARAIARALEAGVTFIDTAPAYGDAEAIVGEVCAGAECVIATKVAVPAGGWERLAGAWVEEHVRRSAERSLTALRRSRVDLLQVHNADAALIARAEVTAALEGLRSEGLVSTCGATAYGEENALAAIACQTFDAVQIAYSALDRRAERALMPAARAAGISLIARSILLRGVLGPLGRELSGAFAALGRAADAFRAAAGTSWSELPGAAVAFVLANPGISRVLLGPRDEHELAALLDGASRFIEVVGELTGGWDAELTPELLDPSRWPSDH
jgi:aryl-alcohol dehydrogenase-like predicted oxidoreductase